MLLITLTLLYFVGRTWGLLTGDCKCRRPLLFSLPPKTPDSQDTSEMDDGGLHVGLLGLHCCPVLPDFLYAHPGWDSHGTRIRYALVRQMHLLVTGKSILYSYV
jgi:hypothetical protein